MSFGGSVQAMITSLKNNALPKRGAFVKRKNYDQNHRGVDGQLKFIELPEEELAMRIAKTHERIKKQKRKEFVVGIILITFGMIFLRFILIAIS